MAATRVLPELRNPMLEEERTPAFEILVERRCLGQTELKVKPGQLGTSNATKPENLGVLDYAHLRAPLPKDLSKSGIFHRGIDRKFPQAYFLMRRSSDGYISATGMFKAAFPFAQMEEEAAEKAYIKSLPSTSTEEVAGNVWLHPDDALRLADEYGMRVWVEALLDPETIVHGTNDPEKDIRSPPPYTASASINGSARTPEKKTGGRRSARARSTRSVSPSKAAAARAPSERVKATPGKRRGRKNQASVDESASVISDAPNGELKDIAESPETVKVHVEKIVDPGATEDAAEIETTKVEIELPIGHPELAIPDDPKEMLAQAAAMVEEAKRINGVSEAPAAKGKGKRKAADMIETPDESGEVVAEAEAGPANKRARVTEVELRKAKIRQRALAGIATTLAVGALIPSIIANLPW